MPTSAKYSPVHTGTQSQRARTRDCPPWRLHRETTNLKRGAHCGARPPLACIITSAPEHCGRHIAVVSGQVPGTCLSSYQVLRTRGPQARRQTNLGEESTRVQCSGKVRTTHAPTKSTSECYTVERARRKPSPACPRWTTKLNWFGPAAATAPP